MFNAAARPQGRAMPLDDPQHDREAAPARPQTAVLLDLQSIQQMMRECDLHLERGRNRHPDVWHDAMSNLATIVHQTLDADRTLEDRARAAALMANHLPPGETYQCGDEQLNSQQLTIIAVDHTLESLRHLDVPSADDYKRLYDRMFPLRYRYDLNQKEIPIDGNIISIKELHELIQRLDERTKGVREAARDYETNLRQVRVQVDLRGNAFGNDQTVHGATVQRQTLDILGYVRPLVGADVMTPEAMRLAVTAWLRQRIETEGANSPDSRRYSRASYCLGPWIARRAIVDDLLPLLWTYIDRHPRADLRDEMRELLVAEMAGLAVAIDDHDQTLGWFCAEGWINSLTCAFAVADPQLNRFSRSNDIDEAAKNGIQQMASKLLERMNDELRDRAVDAYAQGQGPLDGNPISERYREQLGRQAWFRFVIVEGMASAQVQAHVDLAAQAFDAVDPAALDHDGLQPIQSALQRSNAPHAVQRELFGALFDAQERLEQHDARGLTELNALRLQLASRNAQLADKQARLTETNAQLVEKSTRLTEMDERVARHVDRADVLERSLNTAASRVLDQSDRLTTLNDHLARQNIFIGQLKSQLEQERQRAQSAEAAGALPVAAPEPARGVAFAVVAREGAPAGRPALPVAPHADRIEEARRLLAEHRIAVDPRDNRGRTALHLALENGELIGSIRRALRASDVDLEARYGANGGTPLHLAFELDRIDVIRELLGRGANVNAEDASGNTVLHRAAQSGKLDVARELLCVRDIELEALNDGGETPLHLAASSRQVVAVRLLVRSGASINAPDLDCMTPLHRAAANRDADVMRTLLETRSSFIVNVDAERRQDGRTPLHIAAENGDAAGIRLLLLHEASVNAHDLHGILPLHLALKAGSVEAVEALLAAPGAAVYQRDGRGYSAMELAQELKGLPFSVRRKITPMVLRKQKQRFNETR